MYFTILSLDGVPSGPIYYLATLTFNWVRGSKECCFLVQLVSDWLHRRAGNILVTVHSFHEVWCNYVILLLGLISVAFMTQCKAGS